MRAREEKMLTNQEIKEFKKLSLEVYGIKLTDEQATDQGSRLIQLFELVLKNKKLVMINGKVVQSNE